MSALSIAALISVETAATILEMGLSVARVVGLPVDTWRAGDPTRSLYKYLATVLASLEEENAEAIRSGFLSTARGEWLKILALEVYNVEAEEATYATSTLVLANAGYYLYSVEPGDVTVRNSATDVTYHNTSSGTLGALGTLTLDFVADTEGSAGIAAVDEIDTLVTTMLNVTITSSTAAVATDEQSEDSIKAQCTASLGALSPNGPADAYEFIARNAEFTTVSGITRAKSVGNTGTDEVTIYVATASGTVSAPNVALIQSAVDLWATPIGMTPTVISAATTTVNFVAEYVGDPGDVDASEVIAALYSAEDISDGTLVIARSLIIAALHAAMPNVRGINMTSPAADISLALGRIAVQGTSSFTEA